MKNPHHPIHHYSTMTSSRAHSPITARLLALRPGEPAINDPIFASA